ncbi:hypothetical protein [Pedobacter sp. ASV28]|uniref:hypothetical protein n=1 Tax=Pedobacter sp. ASV28 TaxID=2795123 RepID=UPI0018EA7D18|nr:hypothetical protein [Pedobacter sp. ASV28]
MNYATKHYIGNHQVAPRKTTAAVAPTVGRVRHLATETKGREPRAERRTEVRTGGNAADGILKCRFLPKLEKTPSLEDYRRTEADFYASLSRLAGHYGIDPMQTSDFGFPYNMALAMWDMEAKVKRTNKNCVGIRLVREDSKASLVSEERCDVGATLFYVPVVPLFLMLKDPKRKRAAQLLLSACSYLYHIADVPYYRQENSYLYWQYEMHREWVEQDEETDATEIYRSELEKAEHIGDSMERKLFNRINLRVFGQRLDRFNSRDAFDADCWRVARNAFALYTEYPTATIFRNAPVHDDDHDGYDCENEAVAMEKYISFVADTKGWLYESLNDSISSEFNEYGAMEEPTLVKSFDAREITATDLDFENRLFALLDDLCSLFYDYKMEENGRLN